MQSKKKHLHFEVKIEAIKKVVNKSMKLVAGLIPKQKNLWIFGAWEGKTYSDNTKYMFEYVLKYHPEIKAVWITRNKEIIKALRGDGKTCYHKWSVTGIIIAFRAAVAFETEGDGDVSSFLNNTLIIQLWHGLGIKAFQWKNENGIPVFSKELIEKHKKSFWMTTSSLYNRVLEELLDVSQDHMFITGYPRNDTLVTKPLHTFFEEYKKKEKRKMVIYLPTHRNFGNNKNGHDICSVENLLKVDRLLEEKKLVMFYKPHFHELQNLKKVNNTFNNIVLASDENKFGDIYSYIHYFDALISDYSTIIYEFACLQKPIVLFPYDIDDYRVNDGGILPYYWDYQVGPMCYSWEEVIGQLDTLLEVDDWKDKRDISRQAWHQYNDGNNCKRVYETVMRLLS